MIPIGIKSKLKSQQVPDIWSTGNLNLSLQIGATLKMWGLIFALPVCLSISINYVLWWGNATVHHCIDKAI